MARNRQLVLIRVLESDDDEDVDQTASTMLNSVALGSARAVTDQLATANIASDGDPMSMGVLYGPGITLQMPMVGPDEPVMQLMVSLEDEEIAWPVLSRICRRFGWKMMDPDSGRTFGG